MTDLVPADHSPGPARRDDGVLPGTEQRLLDAIPENTKRAYRSQWAAFTAWCAEHDRATMPATAATLADYTAHMCDDNRAPSSIKQAIAAIRTQHRMAGLKGEPDTEAALLVLRGHTRIRTKSGKRVKEAPPITVDVLRTMTAVCDRTTLAGKRDRLLLVLGLALAGRRSELAALELSDVRPDGHGGLAVLIRMSKTDQDAVGEVVLVPRGKHTDTDPVGIYNDWLDALRQLGVDTTTGALLRSVTQHDRLYSHGSISPTAINTIVRRTARTAGLPDSHLYSAHSLRAGFATQAAADNIPVSIWADHGRWSKTSPIPHRYVRTADKQRDNPLKRMGM